MAANIRNGRVPVSIGTRLQKNAELTAKVRRLNEVLQKVIGTKTRAQWDLDAKEPESVLSIHIGEPGCGECTRWIMESLLENASWLEGVFQDMKATLGVVHSYLAEVDKLLGQIRDWIAERTPSLEIVEEPIILEEGLSGKYVAKKLSIRSAGEVVEIVPIAAWSAGTDGRVDVIGREQRHTLFFSKADCEWFWVEERPQVAFRPLTPELLIRLVKDCLE